MPDTFLLFNLLPWELRNQIWEMAVRPDLPGAHFFRLCDELKGDSLDDIPKTDHHIATFDEDICAFYLLLPGKELEAAQTLDGATNIIETNPQWSACLSDGGMWTACKESRRVMELAFDSPKWNEIRRKRIYDYRVRDRCSMSSRSPEQLPDEDEMSATRYFVGNDSVDHCFTVFPNRDLFCLRPLNLYNIGWLNLFHHPLGSPYWGFRGLKHVAIEFDPDWALAVREDRELRFWEPSPGKDIIQYFVETSDNLYDTDTLWFIDYTIQRRSPVPTEEQHSRREPRVFYGSDRRFVEVTNDTGQDSPWQIDYCSEPGVCNSCHDFVEALEDRIDDINDVGSYDGPMFYIPCSFGILACERL